MSNDIVGKSNDDLPQLDIMRCRQSQWCAHTIDRPRFGSVQTTAIMAYLPAVVICPAARVVLIRPHLPAARSQRSPKGGFLLH
eukprot:scaffold24150_cov21-Prasinocladus_malaysianus.AAC.2